MIVFRWTYETAIRVIRGFSAAAKNSKKKGVTPQPYLYYSASQENPLQLSYPQSPTISQEPSHPATH